MTYTELLSCYKNNEFRVIDTQKNATKFYLLRSISKKKTIKKFCELYKLEENIDYIFKNENISCEHIINFIRNEFKVKSNTEIITIEAELNKMQYFDWGGSMGNNLEKNIVNNYIKKIFKYEEIENAIMNSILKSVYGYTLNSWYNHWSSIIIEEIFNGNSKVLPTIDLVEKIDFFIDDIPFDLKVTYFPEELMKEKMASILLDKYGSKSELTCTKKIAKELNITIPPDLNDRSLNICLQNLITERKSIDERAKSFIQDIKDIKKQIIDYYISNPNKLIIWLYENQGEMRFDAANRFYVILIDSKNIFDSWKLKRNVSLLKETINKKINSFNKSKLNNIEFHWNKNDKIYKCISEILFIIN